MSHSASSSRPSRARKSYRLDPVLTQRLAARSIVFLFVIACSLLPFVSASAQTGDSPIKVRGGSTTFFSENPWISGKGKKRPTYCASVKPSDLGELKLENFFPVTIQDFRRREAKSISIPLTTQTWRIEIFGHHETETADALQLSKDGIALQASPNGCSPRLPPASVRISPLGNASFYPPPDLIPAGRYSSNKRFLSQCSSLRRDRCERIAEIHIFDGTAREPRVYTCPDGECSIYVGKDDDASTKSRETSPSK